MELCRDNDILGRTKPAKFHVNELTVILRFKTQGYSPSFWCVHFPFMDSICLDGIISYSFACKMLNKETNSGI